MAAAGAVSRSPRARASRPPLSPPQAVRLPGLLLLLAAAGPGADGAARLYRAGEDAVWVLDSGSVRGATANSSAAWLVQFYSSWCGHCIGYAPTWRALAGDVRGEALRAGPGCSLVRVLPGREPGPEPPFPASGPPGSPTVGHLSFSAPRALSGPQASYPDPFLTPTPVSPLHSPTAPSFKHSRSRSDSAAPCLLNRRHPLPGVARQPYGGYQSEPAA